MSMDLALLRRTLEHAPSVADSLTLAPDLVGITLPDGTFACSMCWARVTGRGCSIGSGAVSVWDAYPIGVRCGGCGR